MHYKYISKIKNTTRGFTLLYASLTAALLLSIGLAIFNIVLKELELSVGARESTVAFYKADTGIECALYHDFQSNVFATSTNDDDGPKSISCAGGVHAVTYGQPGPNSFTRSFSFIRDPEVACNPVTNPDIAVSIFKNQLPNQTTIISSGLSSCDPNQTRRAQRTLRVIY